MTVPSSIKKPLITWRTHELEVIEMGQKRKGCRKLKGPSFAIWAMVAVILSTVSCTGSSVEMAIRQAAANTVRSFLESCEEGRFEELRGYFSDSYLEGNQVPDPIQEWDLEAVLGKLSSFAFKQEDMRFEDKKAVVPVRLTMEGDEEGREEFLSLEWDGSRWLITSFTAMDWRRRPVTKERAIALAEAQTLLRTFLSDCVDHRTDKVFAALSRSFRERYRLERPWTRQEFSGIFGTARSYRYDPAKMEYMGATVEVDVTIEFGSPGNREEQTSRVRLVREEGGWRVDSFPFFLL